jgi:2-keto-4-pentenoate hydratase/2-oxohepta-3-ene-1,7-dioic acid hydratase in catechol pathway
MRWARYSHNGSIGYGIVTGDELRPISGTPFDSYSETGETWPLSDVKLLAPVSPGTFYAVGFNYAAHTREAEAFSATAPKIPEKPDVGSRGVGAIIGPGDSVIIPRESAGIIQAEGELVAVIGKTAKHVPEDRVDDYILGYTIGNDISERVWQKLDRTLWRAKNSDTFKPMGPWIETDVSLPDLVTRIRVNGVQMSEFKTNDMIFGVARFISEITRFVTMHPGDVIWMGAEAPSPDMRAGDVCEVEISGIGVLRNPIAGET